MDFFTLLILALLVGASVAIYLRIFRFVYVSGGGKVVADRFTRADGYLAFGCITIFALQSLQNLHAKGGALPATIDTNLLVVVQLGFWVFIIGTILLSFLFRGMSPSEIFGFERLGLFEGLSLGRGNVGCRISTDSSQQRNGHEPSAQRSAKGFATDYAVI